MTPEIAQTFLQDNFAPWLLTLKPKVVLISSEETHLRMPITDNICRVGGVVTGPALTALADAAMVLACAGNTGEIAPIATATLDTQFLRPASGDSIRAEAEVTRAGASMVFVNCALIAEPSNKAVALVSATFSRAALS